MSLDIYIIKPESFPKDVKNINYFDILEIDVKFKKPGKDIIYVTKDQHNMLLQVCENSSVKDDFKYINIYEVINNCKLYQPNIEYFKNLEVDINGDLIVNALMTDGEWKNIIIESKHVSVNVNQYQELKYIALIDTLDGSWCRSILDVSAEDYANMKEFYSKSELNEFLKYVRNDCKHLFDDMKEDEFVWMNT